MMQDIITYVLVVVAVAYLIWRFYPKKKKNQQGKCDNCN